MALTKTRVFSYGKDCVRNTTLEVRRYTRFPTATNVVLFAAMCLAGWPTASAGFIIDEARAYSKALMTFKNIPLYFKAVHQKTDAEVSSFVADAADVNVMLTPEGAIVASFSRAGVAPAWRMRLVGSNPSPHLTGLDLRLGQSHQFIGSVRAAWRTGMPHYARVQYEDVYPGIDVVYYGVDGHVAFDFVVSPGADPTAIQLVFESVTGKSASAIPTLADDGDLIVGAEGDGIRLETPHVYQRFNDAKTVIPGAFVLRLRPVPGGSGDEAIVVFQLGAYDRSQPLVIDPVLTYSTRLGGLIGLTRGRGIAVDRDGMIYVVGETFGDIIPTENAIKLSLGGSVDAFVTKIDSLTDEIIYSTRLGGTGIDKGLGVVLDDEGRAYVTGSTGSRDFPTQNALQENFAGGGNAMGDAFLAVLSVDGSELLYSSYLGGGGDDSATGIAIDQRGVVFVTGETRSTDFPIQAPLQHVFGGGVADAFVTSVDPYEPALTFSTFVGGNGDDVGAAIAVDSTGHVYLSGETTSSNFKTFRPWQARIAGGISDAFVAKLDPGGSAFVYSTYLGGADSDWGRGIAADLSGHAYVTGRTDSIDFPITAGVFQPVAAGAGDGFVTKFSPDGSALVYSTYLGGSEFDEGRGIAVDSGRQAYVIGSTASPDYFEVTPLQEDFGGTQDVFVTKLGPSGSILGYSTYLGGGREEVGNGIALDIFGSAYVTGVIRSIDFQTVGTFRNLLGQASSGAAFIGKIDRGTAPSPDLPDLAVRLDRVKFGTGSGGDRVVVKFAVQNFGVMDARGPFIIALLLSNDSRANDGDIAIQSVEVENLKAGFEARHKFKVTGLDPLDGKFVIIHADEGNAVIESDELNNMAIRAFARGE